MSWTSSSSSRYNLQRELFETLQAADGPAALHLAREAQPDLILLDLMLPGIHGLEVCRQLRQIPETAEIPIIMLTAKGEEADIVTGLEIGADDSVPKPFSMRLLLARIRAVLRRSGRIEQEGTAVTRIDDLVIDDERHEVTLDGEPLPLTLTEYKLLRFLARNAGPPPPRTAAFSPRFQRRALLTYSLRHLRPGPARHCKGRRQCTRS